MITGQIQNNAEVMNFYQKSLDKDLKKLKQKQESRKRLKLNSGKFLWIFQDIQ